MKLLIIPAILFYSDVSDEGSTIGFALARFSNTGTPDSSFGQNGKMLQPASEDVLNYVNAVAIQNDGKILAGGTWANHSSVTRININGTPDSTFGENGRQITQISGSDDIICSLAVSGNILYAAGTGRFPGNLGTIIKYLLDAPGIPPTVSLTTPVNNATFLAYGNVYLAATASDADGTISKVEFYSGTTLLYTATTSPYAFKWEHILKGNYTLTAKATDNNGLVIVSSPVNIAVVSNTPPVVGIVSPVNTNFTAPATINFEAAAEDPGGRIVQVTFYNGTTLLTNEHKIPYTYQWQNVPAGIYTVTAVAKDNWGAETTSAPVTVTIIGSGNKSASRIPSPAGIKTDVSEEVSVRLLPNTAKNILNIYTAGFQNNKQTAMSVISASGLAIKQMQTAASAWPISLDISSLAGGLYILKIINGDRIIYREFIKMQVH